MKKSPKALLVLLLALISLSCFEDRDDTPITVTDINDFVYRGMDAYYLYRDSVPDLAEDKQNSSNYSNYLASFDSPETCFESLIYNRSTADRFSWITSDYIALEQQFNGVSKNNGMEFGLVRYTENGNDLFGYVRYILPNTSAENVNLKRGDLFYAVNDTPLTVSNWRTLLRQDSFTLNLASYNDNGTIDTTDDSIDPTINKVMLTSIPYTENPVFKTKILQVEGENVGYLMYNGFTSNFDTALNAAFGEFRANNVQHLVLDLRYNPGGSVNSSAIMGSLVTGQFNNQVYAKLNYNSIQQDNNFNYLFVNEANGAALNSLGLNKVYVLATGSSASASEMVINSLKAYIPVIHVGTTTVGKSQASITLYDAPNFTRNEANPRHTYALQPLVAISVNKDNGQVPIDGITPDITLEERINNLGVLGDENEPLLAEALADIAATNKSVPQKSGKTIEAIFDSNDLLPHKKEMYIEQ
ncbi:S41 family peptidase [Lacinutrix neustonica]|uniref:S41 family peptidase n=1 Tax=Lacinutrix neustonica TaxID=2980107 RepID=A0A9E8MZ50_9FLAO|nr:S41 family peptidase [Lacinutrix neustonica]WAC03177.1 S41 family peptidase [Lacinutrix neustonica]